MIQVARLPIAEDEEFLGEKRQQLPYSIRWKCSCGVEHLQHLTDENYLSYPPMDGKPFKHVLWCSACNHSQPIRLRINVMMELVEP